VQPCSATPYRARNATSAARKYSAEEKAILAVQLAHAACHEVTSVDATQFAANCALSSASALSCFVSRFSGRTDMSKCANEDGGNCIRVYSHGIIIAVCVCRHPKVIGVLTLPVVRSLSIIASVILTALASSRTSWFTMLPESCLTRFPCAFLRSCYAHSL
jgi:hypothetical protein